MGAASKRATALLLLALLLLAWPCQQQLILNAPPPFPALSPLALSSPATPSPSASPSPGDVVFESPHCDPLSFVDQWAALLIFYLATGGDYWITRDGWPSFTESIFALVVANTTLQSDELLDGPSQIQQLAALTNSSNCTRGLVGHGVALPSHCCWYGVFCCLTPQCSNGNEVTIESCNCTVGAVTGIYLPHNNLTGSLDGSRYVNNTWQQYLNISVVDILALLSCNLRSLALQNNQLSGALPAALTTLSQLQTLNLGYNQLNGSLPTTLGLMTNFNVLELTGNQLTGTIPRNLCLPNFTSPLTDLFIGSNSFTGTLDLTFCRQLILVDATNNKLSGDLPVFTRNPVLHIVHLDNNNFTGRLRATNYTAMFSGGLITDLSISNNALSGSVPTALADLIYLTSLNLRSNGMTGTLPARLFSNLGTLTSIDVSGNYLTGTLPLAVGLASSLVSLDVSSNSMTGVIPDSLVRLMSNPSRFVNLRFNYLSCCGIGFNNTTNTYSSFNYSAPMLPAGLAQSSMLRPLAVSDSPSFQGLSCPYLYNSSTMDLPENLLNWLVDPQYYLFANCTCGRGYVLANLSVYGEPNITCQLPPSSNEPWWTTMPWVWVFISLGSAVALMAFTWWCAFRRGSRPVLLQNVIDMRKRLLGPPQGGDLISIVTTDIEGYSALMERAPQLTSAALNIHNSLIRKAKWENFGFTVEQEGDSYSIGFRDPADAVKFCLQAQQLLARQQWPEGLFEDKAEADAFSSKLMVGSLKVKRAGTAIFSSLVQGISRMGRSDGNGNASPAANKDSPDHHNSKDGSNHAGAATDSGVASAPSLRPSSPKWFSRLTPPLPPTHSAAMSLPAGVGAGGMVGSVVGHSQAVTTVSATQIELGVTQGGDARAPYSQPLVTSAPCQAPPSVIVGVAGSEDRGPGRHSPFGRSTPPSREQGAPVSSRPGVSGGDPTGTVNSAAAARPPSCAAPASAALAGAAGSGGRASESTSGMRRSHETQTPGSSARPSTTPTGLHASQQHAGQMGQATTRLMTDEMDAAVQLNGLRVRMGIATGTLPVGSTAAGSWVLESAKLVSDAAAGGQVLMCSRTFGAVQHMCEELGCVDHNGTNLTLLNARRAPWWILGAKGRTDKEDAVLLDMGWYVRCARGQTVPTILTPQYLRSCRAPAAPAAAATATGALMGLKLGRRGSEHAQAGEADGGGANAGPPTPIDFGGQSATAGSGRAGREGTRHSSGNALRQEGGDRRAGARSAEGSVGGHGQALDLASIYREQDARQAAEEQGQGGREEGEDEGPRGARRAGTGLMERWSSTVDGGQGCQVVGLYQVLAPRLVGRGRVFGSTLALKQEEWSALDVPYFDAPGALHAPVSDTDIAVAGLELVPVTMVFCMVDGGKLFAARHRRDAGDVHRTLAAVVRSVLRQVPGSYFVKEQDGDLKFMLAFRHPAAALLWCLAVQECAMYVDWPGAAIRYWPEEWDGGQLLFRGPRLKMGVCEGRPRTILPDYLGRADYCGNSINQAARFMDAAAHGGQIACEEGLIHHATRAWDAVLSTLRASPSGPGPDPSATPLSSLQLSTFARQADGSGASAAAGAAGPPPRAAAAPLSLPTRLLPPLPPGAPGGSAGEGRSTHLAGAGPKEGSGAAAAAVLGPGLRPGSELRSGSCSSALVNPSSVSGFAPLQTWMEADGEGQGLDVAPSGALSQTQLDKALQGQGNGQAHDRHGEAAAEEGMSSGGAAGGNGLVGGLGGGRGIASAPALTVQTKTASMVRGMAAPLTAEDCEEESGAVLLLETAVPGAQLDVVALRLGLFKFKGSEEPLSMVSVLPSALVARRFPADPPRGKGGRVAAASGIAATASTPLLDVVCRYRELNEHRARMHSTSAATPRSMPAMELTGTSGSIALRSWASLRNALGPGFGRRSTASSAGGMVGFDERSPRTPGPAGASLALRASKRSADPEHAW